MSRVELAEIACSRPQTEVRVLRGLEGDARPGGDIDLIVPPGRARAVCLDVARAAAAQDWFMVSFRDLGYVCSGTFIRAGAVSSDNAVKLDFIDGFAWHGIDQGEPVSNPFSPLWQGVHDSWRDLRIVGALAYFQKIMAAGAVSPREWERICASGADASYLASVAKILGFPPFEGDAAPRRLTMIQKWKMRTASAGVRGHLRHLHWFTTAVARYGRSKLGVGAKGGFVVGVSGLDGSGKSTLLERFVSSYERAGNAPLQTIHLLPSWIPMPHQIFLRKKTQSAYHRPYSEPPVSSRLSGALRLSFYLLAFAAARISVGWARSRGAAVVLDRSFLDFASDLTRARIPHAQLPSWLLRLLIPAGDLFYLDASPSTVVARKGELTLEKAFALRVSYLSTCAAVQATRLDAEESPDTVFKSLLSCISQRQIRRAAE
jgi:thymidylate kinase